MLIYNGVQCETIEQLEELMVGLSEEQKQFLRNDFNGVENTPIETPMPEKELKIFEHIHENFDHLKASKIDFTIHLKTNVVLIKKTEMNAKGRPVAARYYYPSVSPENLMAQIDFEFTDNAMGFMIDRKEKLKYYKQDGTFEGPFVISHRTYDFANLTEATYSIQERTQARKTIMDEVKVFLNGVIVQYYLAQGLTQSQANVQAMTIGGHFIMSHADIITAFIDTASTSLRSYVASAEATGNEAFLAIPIGTGVTVRDYWVARLTY